MTNNTDNGGCVLSSLAMAAVIGLFAMVVARFFGELSWPGSVFLGALAFVVSAALALWIFCRPLPALNQDDSAAASAPAPAPKAAAAPAPAPAPAKPAAKPAAAKDSAPAVSDDWKPQTLAAARDGGADDLKLIKGVGPKLEKLCHSLGFYHFDQVASWTANEVAWVDENLEGFKGRVSRDEWVSQAKILAAGGETEFSKRNKK